MKAIVALVLPLLSACMPWSSSLMPLATPTPFIPGFSEREPLELTIHNGWRPTPIMLHQDGCQAFRLPTPPNINRGGHPGDRITVVRMQSCATTIYAATLPRDVVICALSVDKHGAATVSHRGIDTDCGFRHGVWTYNLRRRFRPPHKEHSL
jgi:hypothetical protein